MANDINMKAELTLDNKEFIKGIKDAEKSITDLEKTSKKTTKEIVQQWSGLAVTLASISLTLHTIVKELIHFGVINKKNTGRWAESFAKWATTIDELYKRFRPATKAATDFADTMTNSGGALRISEKALAGVVDSMGKMGKKIKDVSKETELFQGTAKEATKSISDFNDVIEDVDFVEIADTQHTFQNWDKIIKSTKKNIIDLKINEDNLKKSVESNNEEIIKGTNALIVYNDEVENASDETENLNDETEKGSSAFGKFAKGAGQAAVQAFVFQRYIKGVFLTLTKFIPILGTALAILAAVYHSVKFAAQSATLYIKSSVELQDKLARTKDGVTAWGLAWKDAGLWVGKFTSSFTLFWGTFKSFLSKGSLQVLGLDEYIDQAKELIELRIKLQRSEQQVLSETQTLGYDAEDALRIINDITKKEKERKEAAIEWFKSESAIIGLKRTQLEGELTLNKAIKERSDEIDAEEQAIGRNLIALDREQLILSRGLSDYYMLISKIEEDGPLAGSIDAANIELSKLIDKLNSVTTEGDRIKLRVEIEAKEIQIQAMLNGIPTPVLNVKVELDTTAEQDLAGIDDIDLSGLMDVDDNDLTDWAKETSEGLGTVVNAMNGVASSAEGMTNALQGMFDGENVLASFGDFLIELASLMVQFGVLLSAFGTAQEVFEKGGAYAKIAAGIAMVGLAIKIGTSVANISKAGSSGGKSSGGSSSDGSTYSAGSYDYNREIILTARGEDLVGVLNKQNFKDGING